MIGGPSADKQDFIKGDDDATRLKSGQIRPVTTARKDTNSTAVKVNITVSAISPHCDTGAIGSAMVSTGSAGKAAGVSLNIHGPFRMTQQSGIIRRQR
jgi:hypothetical protein